MDYTPVGIDTIVLAPSRPRIVGREISALERINGDLGNLKSGRYEF